MEQPMPVKPTTRRGSTYAERDNAGQFEDVQTYERAHGQDVKRRSKAEANKKR